ncbi:MAG: hypothetical protein HY903_10570 [Deltaproteobacteria bacterium]|nr:hypothetical protein [Deltaproteobacteria bacterium]
MNIKEIKPQPSGAAASPDTTAGTARAQRIRQAASVRDVAELGAGAKTQRAAAPVEASSLPPPSPPTTSLSQEGQQGALAFANQLTSLSLRSDVGLGGADLVAAFMKLQTQDASLGQDIEAQLEAARHELRVAALNLERQLEHRLDDVQSLRQEAQALQDDAELELDRAMTGMDTGTVPVEGEAGASLATGVGGSTLTGTGAADPNAPSAKVEAGAWKAAFDSLIGDIKEAAALRAEVDRLRALGDGAGAEAKEVELAAAERSLKAAFEIVGIPGTDERARALETAAVESRQAGKGDRDILARYFAAHPDDLAILSQDADPSQILEQGFGAEELAAAVKSNDDAAGIEGEILQAFAAADEEEVRALVRDSLEGASYASGGAGGGALGKMLGGASGTNVELDRLADQVTPMLMSAGGKMLDAMEKLNQANLIWSAYNDARQAARDARGYEQTAGLADRNAARQKELLDPLYVTMAGDRADQQLARDGRVQADEARNLAAKAVLEMVDRQSLARSGFKRGG